MKLREIMTCPAIVVSSDATVEEAADLMNQHNIGLLPICDKDRLVGVITDRDIVVRAISNGRHSVKSKVASIMTPSVHYCYEDQTIENAIGVMATEQIHRLLVLNHSKRLSGIISISDIALRGANLRLAGEALAQVSAPTPPSSSLEMA